MIMKKTTCGFLLAIGLCCSALHTSAEPAGKGGGRAAFMKGDNTLGFSMGLGHQYHASTSHLPAFAINYDHGIVDNVGPGTIGIGGIVGWQRSVIDYANYHQEAWTNFIVGFRATYHLTILKDKNNKFDPYGGLTVGIRSETYRNEPQGNHNADFTDVKPLVGPFIGAKYNFRPQFGAFSELGFDVAFFKIGLHVNF